MKYLLFIILSLSQSYAFSVVTTVEELASIARSIGGREIQVHSLTSPYEDPHFVEIKPGYVRRLHGANLLILMGMEMEIGWLPKVITQSRNSKVSQGHLGYLDASHGVLAVEVPVGNVDRSEGDVHRLGNPHYLIDPVEGYRVAGLVRDRLSAMIPEKKEVFTQNFKLFEKKLVTLLFGEKIAQEFPAHKLMKLVEVDRWYEFLKERGGSGGLLKNLSGLAGQKFVQGHKYFSYLARRLRLDMDLSLEPRPGVRPSFKYLASLVKKMRETQYSAILYSPHFPEKFVNFVKEKTGVEAIQLSHQLGSKEKAKDYLDWVKLNFSLLLGTRDNS